MSDHTPTPWLKPCEDEVGVISKADDQSYGMRVPILTCYSANADADADFIVKAVNYHDRLRDALREVAATLDWQRHGQCRGFGDAPILTSSAAIAKARALLTELENLEKQQ